MKKPEIIYIPETKKNQRQGMWYNEKFITSDQTYISLDLVKQMIEHIELANDVVKKLNKLTKN